MIGAIRASIPSSSILNTCRIFMPLITYPPNNSVAFGLDLRWQKRLIFRVMPLLGYFRKQRLQIVFARNRLATGTIWAPLPSTAACRRRLIAVSLFAHPPNFFGAPRCQAPRININVLVPIPLLNKLSVISQVLLFRQFISLPFCYAFNIL